MMAESEIASETLRYSVDLPAQALGYKVGAMEFWRLRRKAEQELGSRFDVRAFHALILDAGGLPMTVVGAMVDRWIARILLPGLSTGNSTTAGASGPQTIRSSPRRSPAPGT